MRLKIDEEQIDIMDKFLDEVLDVIEANRKYGHEIDYSIVKGIIYNYQSKLDRLK